MSEPLILIAGPCVAESLSLCREVCNKVLGLTEGKDLRFFFKASFDKANRTSIKSYRGPGLDEGLKILQSIRQEFGVSVLTDIHLPSQASVVAEVVDVLQIPAFLCRQTDLLAAAAETTATINIKKGQFLAPEAMLHVANKVREVNAARELWLTERGTSFGYGNLVVDFRGIGRMRETTGLPIILDATHSAQQPSTGSTTGGNRVDARVLARAGAAAGIEGLFCEVHPRPEEALSDGPNSLDFDLFEKTLTEVVAIRGALSPREA